MNEFIHLGVIVLLCVISWQHVHIDIASELTFALAQVMLCGNCILSLLYELSCVLFLFIFLCPDDSLQLRDLCFSASLTAGYYLTVLWVDLLWVSIHRERSFQSSMMQEGMLSYSNGRFNDSVVVRLSRAVKHHEGKIYLGLRLFDIPEGSQGTLLGIYFNTELRVLCFAI